MPLQLALLTEGRKHHLSRLGWHWGQDQQLKVHRHGDAKKDLTFWFGLGFILVWFGF
jgi:hypothetical protein